MPGPEGLLQPGTNVKARDGGIAAALATLAWLCLFLAIARRHVEEVPRKLPLELVGRLKKLWTPDAVLVIGGAVAPCELGSVRRGELGLSVGGHLAQGVISSSQIEKAVGRECVVEVHMRSARRLFVLGHPRRRPAVLAAVAVALLAL